jgi:DNA-binding NtrC family response regulator
MSNEKKILIVEDEAVVVEMLERYLSAQDSLKEAKIFYATNVDQCLEILEREKPSFMILDLSINGSPEETGFRILKKYSDKVRIVVMSAYLEFEDQCKHLGAIKYITKSAKRDVYLNTILECA